VPDRCVGAFCGRAPKTVLARKYSDFSPEKLGKPPPGAHDFPGRFFQLRSSRG